MVKNAPHGYQGGTVNLLITANRNLSIAQMYQNFLFFIRLRLSFSLYLSFIFLGKRRMVLFGKNLVITTTFLVLSFTPVAWAGFEWMPPAQKAASMAVPAPVSNDQNYNTSMMDNMPSPGFPAPQVMAEPLDAPTSILPPVAPVVQPQKSSSGGLFIDPYPLRSGQTSTMDIAPASVQQAMAEQAQVLNPLPLGVGLNTGAKPRSLVQPSASSSSRTGGIPRAPMGGLTPMLDGEPAPLPGVTLDYGDTTIPYTRPSEYAEAVGFGRDLPLALALSQVIPSEFSHSFADDVDAGTTVSWEGGKPWDVVLKEMLRPAGLTAVIRGGQVSIQPLARG